MTDMMSQLKRDTLARCPEPPTTPVEALDHVLALSEDASGDRVVMEGTSNIYGKGVRTGLTLDDLRRVKSELLREAASAVTAETHGMDPSVKLLHRMADDVDPRVHDATALLRRDGWWLQVRHSVKGLVAEVRLADAERQFQPAGFGHRMIELGWAKMPSEYYRPGNMGGWRETDKNDVYITRCISTDHT